MGSNAVDAATLIQTNPRAPEPVLSLANWPTQNGPGHSASATFPLRSRAGGMGGRGGMGGMGWDGRDGRDESWLFQESSDSGVSVSSLSQS